MIIPLVVWSMLGLMLAVSAGARGDGPPPVDVRFGPVEGGLYLPGRLLSLTETAGRLRVEIGVRPGMVPEVDNPHDDLEIEFIELTEPAQGPPRIEMPGSDAIQLSQFRGAALSAAYVIKYGPTHISITVRPEQMTSEQFHRILRRDGQPLLRRGPGPEERDRLGNQPPPPQHRQPRSDF